ncbi:MAG: flagellar basal body M-ring protein FliF [Spirochaetales bacterium]|nr:MAG: flagellar basal body M-ring protein FliF [Spirochaetales bacterium]
MNEWFKRLIDNIKKVWSKWKPTQKIIFFSIIGAVLLGLVLIIAFSSSPSMAPLISSPIKDPQLLDRISIRLDEENVKHTITGDGRILVSDSRTAQRMVAVLAREDLIPPETSPWDIFKMDRWTLTDFERNVNLRQAVTRSVEQHIEALDDVDSAQVTLVMPEKELFTEDQDPVTASIILTPKPGSDITVNRKKIEGIVKLIQFAVQGLRDENITIVDSEGNTLNDFAGLENLDRLELAKREMKTKRDLERQYKNDILKELMQIYGQDRVKIVNVDITLDMGKKSVQTEEHFPITLEPDNPRTPFSELKVQDSITISSSTVDERFRGTGFNPEGPPGQEGQTPPAYKDLEGMVGDYSNVRETKNQVVNTRNTNEEKSPWSISRTSIAVAIDGTWKWKYDDKGNVLFNSDGSIQREYVPVPDGDLAKAKTLVEHAVGYNRDRGDTVTVQHLQFDRNSQFQKEDDRYRAQQRTRRAFLYGALGLAGLLIIIVIARFISREMERRRKLREEELARQHQAMREAALRQAEEEAVEVSMSVEERARLEMQENAINLAREHPEDVAQLIRTWLMEE